MFKKLVIVALAFVIGFANVSKADEGMWLPMLIKRLNEVDMQKSGLKLTAEEIYSVNNSSLKDAIISFGGFCTGEMISDQGLILTNHHCGFDFVQNHSTVDHDYVTNGYWAMTRDQELSNPGLTASYLVRMEDMTAAVKAQLSDTMSETTRTETLTKIYKQYSDEYSEGGRYKVDVKSFLHGNEFYMFIYEVFKDVRLVGAPPEAIGNYGGDIDNWMWPRHTGDFSMFRVYCGPDGKPAEYSKDNVPFKPKHFLPVSIAGVKKDDYAMIMGYPGRTDRYRFSSGVQNDIEQSNPARVKIRTKKLETLKAGMDANDSVRIMYAAKYDKVSNYWKYFIGATKGLKRMGVVEQKKAFEGQFDAWASTSNDFKLKYGNVTSTLRKSYTDIRGYNLASTYLTEAISGTEILPYAYKYAALEKLLSNKESKPEEITKAADKLKTGVHDYFVEYHMPTDRNVTAAMLEMYSKDVPASQQAPYFTQLAAKYKGDFSKLSNDIFAKSMFASEAKVNAFLANPSAKKLAKDPAYMLMNETMKYYTINVRGKVAALNATIDKSMRSFVEGQRIMLPEKKFYPDANSTMRLTYGKVADYYPSDAVYYNFFTTIDGLMEKMDNTVPEFVVPQKMVDLWKKKDYGVYGENGNLRVCFITTNDITGGNSGSPVINAKGELIGCAFDGNWEAMSGDIAYDPVYKRTICADIRYILWVVDKYAGAGHLVKEMKIMQ